MNMPKSVQDSRYKTLLDSGLWETRDGEVLEISKMSTQHIKNCIRFIYKSNGIFRPEYLRLFENELRRRKYENFKTSYNGFSESVAMKQQSLHISKHYYTVRDETGNVVKTFPTYPAANEYVFVYGNKHFTII